MGIFFDSNNKSFYLESKNLSYLFKIDEFGFLQHLYYGKRIAREDLDYSVHKAVRGHTAYLAEMGPENTYEVLSAECPL